MKRSNEVIARLTLCCVFLIRVAATEDRAMGADRNAVMMLAKAAWNLGDGGAGSPHMLTPAGTVQLHRPPTGIAANPAAQTALLTNGYFDAGAGLGVAGAQLTVYLRVRDPRGLWFYGLLAKRGSHVTCNYNLFSVDLGGDGVPDIGFEVHTTAGFCSVSFPLSRVGATAWHDLVGRYDGRNVELFCDGRLMARRAWNGTLTQNAEPTLIGAETDNGSIVRPFTGSMEEAGIWDRALSADELAAVMRKPGVLEWPSSFVHYRPADYPLGDIRPQFVGGEFVCSYLYNPPAFNCALLRSNNLLDWTRSNPTHTPPSAGQVLPPYYVLSFLLDPGAHNYRTFYGSGDGVRASVSTNLAAWDFASPQRQLPSHPDLYDRESDPTVFWNPDRGDYWMVLTLRKKGVPPLQAGAVGYATSPDLKSWTWQGELYSPGNVGDPECPSMFKMGDKWCLLASYADNRVGRPSYRVADAPEGPWQTRVPDCLDGKDMCAAMSCDTGTTRILFGWIPLSATPPQASQFWGGHMALPRQVVQLPDGALGCRLEPSVAAKLTGPAAFPGAATAVAKSGNWTVSGADASFTDQSVCGLLLITGAYDSFMADCDLMIGTTAPRAGLILDWSESDPGFEVMVDRVHLRLTIGAPGNQSNAEIALPNLAQKPLHLKIIVEQDIVELFFDDSYSLCARLPRKLLTTSVCLAAPEGGPVDFRNVTVRALPAPPYIPENSVVDQWLAY
ncbi:MAG: LamG-like jellyroll fold domain-containing protein [bacterium]|nr:hypothetical protein [Candidatus Sumerlaeota bacterium]